MTGTINAPSLSPSPAAPSVETWDYRRAWDLETARRARCVALNLPPGPGWTQAAQGAPDTLAVLQSAFETLRRDGRLSRFPRQNITVARQGTCAPYGLPAVLVQLTGACRTYVEQFGLRLLSARPHLPCLLEVSPGVVLIENTPPLDNLWEEARFWQAWRTLPAEAWELVRGWAAIRVLRYVETPTGTHRFYNPALPSPAHGAGGGYDGTEHPLGDGPEPDGWRASRCADASVALDPNTGTELRRFVLGRLATPFPCPRGPLSPAVCAVENALARAAHTLQTEAGTRRGPVKYDALAGLRDVLAGYQERVSTNASIPIM